MNPATRSTLAAGLLAVLTAALAAQSATEIVVADYHKRSTRAFAEAGQRHLQLGSWARKVGLVPQATAQFLRAVEVSKGRNPGAVTVLGIMRGYGDAFWQKRRERPPRALLAEFERRSADIEKKSRTAHAELAQRAGKARLDDVAKQHWLEVLRLGGELTCDAEGQWRLDGARVPDALAEWLQRHTAKVNDSQFAFEIAAAAPKLAGAIECRSERLTVRTDLPRERAEQLLALADALWPLLQDRLDGAPTRPMRLFVFARRADFDAYLEARGLGRHKAGRGLADYGADQTLVCADGLADAELQAITLHELTHLFFFGTAPAVMPDWYAEGFAESFGGQGTFRWDGKTLVVGDLMRRDRLEDLQQNPLPLAELLAGDAAQMLAADAGKGLRFYAQSWALLRFLQQPGCPWNARFLHFEQRCRGQVLGAPEGGKLPMGSRAPADKLWHDLFHQDQDQLEQAFGAWLRSL